MQDELTLIRPDDWHVHFRDGLMMQSVVNETARDFARALVMPNLVPPVTTGADAVRYRDDILASLELSGAGAGFTPLMTLYLTEDTDPDDLERAASEGLVVAVKLYPAGATTNSQSGVSDIRKVMPVLERMAGIGLPLCVHGEVTDNSIDIFDREAVFIERILAPLREELPELKTVMEHVTTADGVDYVMSQSQRMGATITPHHLILNRNHLLAGGIRPHYYCLPVVKRETHRLALRAAATSGDSRFFLGTDSAPHTDTLKQAACGCAGVFNATNTLACLAHVFEEENSLDKLEGFVSLNGPAFYSLPTNDSVVTLRREKQAVQFPGSISAGEESVTVFDPGFDLFWSVVRP